MTTNPMQEAAAAIKAAGYQVYMRNPSDTYAYYTDGTRIAYIQNDRFLGYTISTTHIPNTSTGTGFHLGSVCMLDKENFDRGFMVAPDWAYGRDRASVRKWKNWEHFQNYSAFNKEFIALEA